MRKYAKSRPKSKTFSGYVTHSHLADKLKQINNRLGNVLGFNQKVKGYERRLEEMEIEMVTIRKELDMIRRILKDKK